MRPPPNSAVNRRIALAAIALFVVLGALVVAQRLMPRGETVLTPHRTADVARTQATALPGAVSPTGANPSLVGLPALALDGADSTALVDPARVAAQPEGYVGALFSCRNTVDPLPIFWNPEDLRAAPARPDKVRDALAEAAPGLARQRLALLCKTPDLHTVAVQVYFDVAVVGALTSIARDTAVTLQLIGVGAAGQLVARFVRVTALPRPAPLPDPLRPDWLAALMQLEPSPPVSMTCVTGAAPRLVPLGTLDATTRVALADLPGTATTVHQDGPGAVAQLTCTDARQLQIPVLVKFSQSQQADLLAVTEGTVLRLHVLRAVDNRVVAAFADVIARADPAPAGDLRRLLLDPEHAAGKVVRCVSLGLPTAQTVEVADADAAWLDTTAYANRKSWLVCDQAPRPPVQVTLWLQRGHLADLLTIGRGTEVSLRVLAVDGDRLLAALHAVVARPTEPDLRADDLRRYVLQTEELIGQKLRCPLGRELELVGSEQAPDAARRLFPNRPAGAPRLATCLDALRPFEGQRFLVFWPEGRPASADLPHTGASIELELRGLVNNLPVAGYVRRLDRR